MKNKSKQKKNRLLEPNEKSQINKHDVSILKDAEVKKITNIHERSFTNSIDGKKSKGQDQIDHLKIDVELKKLGHTIIAVHHFHSPMPLIDPIPQFFLSFIVDTQAKCDETLFLKVFQEFQSPKSYDLLSQELHFFDGEIGPFESLERAHQFLYVLGEMLNADGYALYSNDEYNKLFEGFMNSFDFAKNLTTQSANYIPLKNVLTAQLGDDQTADRSGAEVKGVVKGSIGFLKKLLS